MIRTTYHNEYLWFRFNKILQNNDLYIAYVRIHWNTHRTWWPRVPLWSLGDVLLAAYYTCDHCLTLTYAWSILGSPQIYTKACYKKLCFIEVEWWIYIHEQVYIQFTSNLHHEQVIVKLKVWLENTQSLSWLPLVKRYLAVSNSPNLTLFVMNICRILKYFLLLFVSV